MIYFFFFFFSSRRRHTRCSRDWSSDVCSSDLEDERVESLALHHLVDPVGSRHPEILGAASPIRRGAEPVRGVGRQKEDLTESQHLLGTGLVEADQLSQGSDR